MADLLPAKAPRSILTPEGADRVVDALYEGLTVSQIATKAHPRDARKRRRLKRRLERELANNPDVLQRVYERGRLRLVSSLGPTLDGLAARAARGRPDAAKLILAATGFYQPGVKHDHSGEIKIKLEMPRPERTEDVVDAEVVEEG